MFTTNETTEKITGFLQEIGLEISYEDIPGKTFVPGILIRNGGLVIDHNRLAYPGDLLHEAGHLATMPPSVRAAMNDDLGGDPIHLGGEFMAIAWSYAACLHLKIDPHVVFHEQGYKGEGANIVENFAAGRYLGVPLLQWYGLTRDPDNKHTQNSPAPAYPQMHCWVNADDTRLATG